MSSALERIAELEGELERLRVEVKEQDGKTEHQAEQPPDEQATPELAGESPGPPSPAADASSSAPQLSSDHDAVAQQARCNQNARAQQGKWPPGVCAKASQEDGCAAASPCAAAQFAAASSPGPLGPAERPQPVLDCEPACGMKHPASAPVAGLQQAGGAAGWSFRTGPPPFPGSYAPPAAYYGNSGGLDALGFGGAQLSGSGGHPGVSPSPDGTAVVQQDNSEQMRVAGAGFGWSPPCAPSVCGGCGFEGGVCGYRGLPGTGPPGGFGFFEPPPQARFDSPEHSTAQQ